LKRHMLILLPCLFLLAGCPSPSTRQPHAGSSREVVELNGAEAEAAKSGKSRGGVYVDVMSDGTFVFDDAPSTSEQLERELKTFVAGGGRLVTIRLQEGTDAKKAAYVQAAAKEVGVPRIELVRFASP
jgi:biopolymer transport protein ExbD